MVAGGDFREVEHWLRNFVVSHAKRESPRIEAIVEADEERRASYGVRLRLGERLSPRVELDFKTVANGRASLEWCAALAAQVRCWAGDLLAAAGEAHAPRRPA